MVALCHTYTRTGRQLAEMKCINEVPLTPAMVILSINIDLLSLRSFRYGQKSRPSWATVLTPRKTSPPQLTCSTRDALARDTAAEDLSAGASGTLTARKDAAAEQQ